jgi:SPP1 gp7 family putative phage head morphogenesis protein
MANYWAERTAATQAALTKKSVKETEKQLIKYYTKSLYKISGQFQQTYNKLLLSIDEGREPTPADLYNLDKYWQMQGQLKKELQKLGDKQHELFSKSFISQYENIYKSLALPSGEEYGTISRETVEQMINQIWCADGKSWSSRIWTNTDKLQQALNDNLIDCVLTGKTSSELKKMLQREFSVSYSNADMIARTELAHIQTEAAKKRYEDYGIREVEILADEDERQCEVCGKLHGQRYPIGAAMPVPAHPRCRCCIIPVVD